MLEGFGPGTFEAMRRGRSAREDRLGEAEDVERRRPVEPGDPRHRVERFQALDDMPEGDSPFAREHLRTFHHHDRIGPAEGRATAAIGAPRPPPGDLGSRGRCRPTSGAGGTVVRIALALRLPPRALPGPFGKARVAVAGGRERREPEGEDEAQPGMIDDGRKRPRGG